MLKIKIRGSRKMASKIVLGLKTSRKELEKEAQESIRRKIEWVKNNSVLLIEELGDENGDIKIEVFLWNEKEKRIVGNREKVKIHGSLTKFDVNTLMNKLLKSALNDVIFNEFGNIRLKPIER
ncbi:MAG: hypothetical protein PHE43_00735 [Candidatus Nanoarchaeia archaeon]|nr:hypothetical protein [Candidatus Nanoarchaeia archaeon]